ncbi:MAG: hypothetical protein F6K03_17370, partial [Kamptonema sp. SIO4C4]|nr:hypothetical protein [Kamptonema sp. SIO4C4]
CSWLFLPIPHHPIPPSPHHPITPSPHPPITLSLITLSPIIQKILSLP